MPIDTIERAIKRGTGELEGVTYESVTYEGYAPGGVAVLVEVLTDNRNRTGAEIRNIFTQQRRLVGRARRGVVAVRAQGRGHRRRIARARTTSCSRRSTPAPRTSPTTATRGRSRARRSDLAHRAHRARGGRDHRRVGRPHDAPDHRQSPLSTAEDAKKVLRVIDALEEHDDVQNVYANFDIPDSILETVEA